MRRTLYALFLLIFITALVYAFRETDHCQVLSKHETTAIFNGIQEQQCFGRTALCPDKCGDSGEKAVFSIVEYISYEKTGQYGDPKQEVFQILTRSGNKPKIPPHILRKIEKLNTGDTVSLSFCHNYITTKEGSQMPERIITKMKKR